MIILRRLGRTRGQPSAQGSMREKSVIFITVLSPAPCLRDHGNKDHACQVEYDGHASGADCLGRGPMGKALSALALVLLAALVACFVEPAAARQDSVWEACENGNIDRAISACTRIIDRGNRESEKNRALAHNNRGYLYIEKGDYERAIRDLDEAIRLEPNNALFRHNRGDAYYRNG